MDSSTNLTPEVTLEGQFELFSTLNPLLYKQHSRLSRLSYLSRQEPEDVLRQTDQPPGTIRLPQSDYWMRQANILEDRHLTMTDTGITYFYFEKVFMTFEEWCLYLEELCKKKDLDLEAIKTALTNCGIPGQTPVNVPDYRKYYLTFKPKEKGLVNKDVPEKKVR